MHDLAKYFLTFVLIIYQNISYHISLIFTFRQWLLSRSVLVLVQFLSQIYEFNFLVNLFGPSFSYGLNSFWMSSLHFADLFWAVAIIFLVHFCAIGSDRPTWILNVIHRILRTFWALAKILLDFSLFLSLQQTLTDCCIASARSS